MGVQKHIALIGMMGVGKTTLGKKLAERLDCRFIDSDQEITRRAGCSINDMFAAKGEATFRAFEEKVIKNLLSAPEPTVIATGGGCVTTPATLKALKAEAITIWLQASPECIYERIKMDTSRPLLQNENPLGALQTLTQHRENLYAQADIAMNIEQQNRPQIIQTLIKEIEVKQAEL